MCCTQHFVNIVLLFPTDLHEQAMPMYHFAAAACMRI